MKLLAVFTTVASREDATRLANAAIAGRLAACVQMSAIDSTYRWEGEVQHEGEIRLLFKTTAERYPALAQAVLELHPYALPALYATEVVDANEPYAAWVCAQVAPLPD